MVTAMDQRMEQAFLRWMNASLEDPDLVRDLESIRGNEGEIYDRFYRDLEFGTGGLRGVLGAGSNRMNIYTVRQATQGLADYLLEQYESPTVAIAHDSRIKSDLFARTAAQVLAANGIGVWLYRELMPTPSLSYACLLYTSWENSCSGLPALRSSRRGRGSWRRPASPNRGS